MKPKDAGRLFGKRRKSDERNYYYGNYLFNRYCIKNDALKGEKEMETLMKAINKILEDKDMEIYLLNYTKERLEKENEEMRAEIAELKKDIEKYEENEVNRV